MERANAVARRYDEKPLLGKRKFIASVLERLEGMDDAISALEREEEERRAYLMNEKLKQLLIAPDKMDEMNELEKREKLTLSGVFTAAINKIRGAPGAVKTDEAENESDPGDPTAGAVTSPPRQRRMAEIWTDAQTKQNTAIFTAIKEAYEWAEKAEVEQQAEKHNWMKRVALKTAKIIVCVGLFAITAILGASGIGIALLGLGVGLAFAAMEAYQSYKEGQTAGGVGAFVFNVVKGGAMTALGLEIFSESVGLVVSILDLVCTNDVDLADEIVIPWTKSKDAAKPGVNAQAIAAMDQALASGKIEMVEAQATKITAANDKVKAEIDKQADATKKDSGLKEFAANTAWSAGAETAKYFTCAAHGAAAVGAKIKAAIA